MAPRPHTLSLPSLFLALLFFLAFSRAHDSLSDDVAARGISHVHARRHAHHHRRYERRIDVVESTDLASNEIPSNSSSLVKRNDGSCARDRPCGNKACCGPSGFCGYGNSCYCEMIESRRADSSAQVQNIVEQDVCPTVTQELNVESSHPLRVNSVHSIPGEYTPHAQTI